MFGYYRMACAVPSIQVANTDYNGTQITTIIAMAQKHGVDVLALPQLCLTGATCGDLFSQQVLLKSSEKNIMKIVAHTKETKMLVFMGAPLRLRDEIVNGCIAIQSGKVLGVVPNQSGGLWTHFKKDFTGHETFCIAGQEIPLLFNGVFQDAEGLSIEVCFSTDEHCFFEKTAKVKILLPTMASHVEQLGRLAQEIAGITGAMSNTIVYASPGYGESTTDAVFAGSHLIAQKGAIIQNGKIFSRENELIFSDIDLTLQKCKVLTSTSSTIAVVLECEKEHELFPKPSTNPFLPPTAEEQKTMFENMLSLQKFGLIKRMMHTHIDHLVLGISGGLDSTIALLVAVLAKDELKQSRKEIFGYTLPGFGTSSKTYDNAKRLMTLLEISNDEISIVPSCEQHFKDIQHPEGVLDVAFENAQARERTQILFDIANMKNGLVVGTGDFTESALGFATYNGDHISNYNVNANLPKTVIRAVIQYIIDTNYFKKEINDILYDIIHTHISPELLPPSETGEIAQKTEELVGPYELNDFFLYYVVKYGFEAEKIVFLCENAFQGKYEKSTIEKHLTSFYRRFITQQFKRSCATDGPGVFDFSLSPRTGFQMPSDANMSVWISNG